MSLHARCVYLTRTVAAQLGYIAQAWFSQHFKVGRMQLCTTHWLHQIRTISLCPNLTLAALQIAFQRVLVQSSLHPPPHVIAHVLAAADAFAQVLVDMPESAIIEVAQAFANKMREPEHSIALRTEKIADEV